MVDMGTAMRDAASAQDVSRYAAGEAHVENTYQSQEVVAGPFMLEHADVAMPGEADSNVVRLYLSPDCADSSADTTHVGTLWTTVGSGNLWASRGGTSCLRAAAVREGGPRSDDHQGCDRL